MRSLSLIWKHCVWLLSRVRALLPEEQPSSIYEEMHSNDMVVVTSKLISVFCHRPPLATNSRGMTCKQHRANSPTCKSPQCQPRIFTYLQNQVSDGCRIPSAACPQWSWPQTFRCFQWRSCREEHRNTGAVWSNRGQEMQPEDCNHLKCNGMRRRSEKCQGPWDASVNDSPYRSARHLSGGKKKKTFSSILWMLLPVGSASCQNQIHLDLKWYNDRCMYRFLRENECQVMTIDSSFTSGSVGFL